MGKPDPNAVILVKLDAIRDEIMGRLDRIEEEPKILKNDILNQITVTIYINSFGGELNIYLKIKLKDWFQTRIQQSIQKVIQIIKKSRKCISHRK